MSGSGTVAERDFLDVMAEVCTPVTVVTGLEAGAAHGTTVSAFSSLSLRPAMVVIALDRASDLLAMLRRTQRFGVNVLGSSQRALAEQFADKGADKFRGVTWTAERGLPRLAEAVGWLSCRAQAFVDGGDHVLVPGLVEQAIAAPAPPLAYHRRVYGTHCEFTRLSA
jgi:flavin reductase (DIM6/NTAB) family NADH-FMN oxidoreductase RutF